MRFINPKTDFAFKRVFGSEHSKPSLISFLNALLNLKHPHLITDVTILDPYQAPKLEGIKDTYVDVKAIDEEGKRYIIEMQVLNVQGFEQRVLYNACKNYSVQIERGDEYLNLMPVIAITITDFIMFKDDELLQHDFAMRDKEGKLYNHDLRLLFVELPKFKKDLSQLDSLLDKWLFFLRSASSLEMVPDALKDDQAIVSAFDKINRAGLSFLELDAQEKREFFIRDQKVLKDENKKILQQNQELAEENQELAEELKHYKREMVKSLLPFLDDATIAAKTGVSEAEVQALRQTSPSS